MRDGQEDRQFLQQEAERVQNMRGYKQVIELKKNLDAQVLRVFEAIHAARQAQTDPSKYQEILAAYPSQDNNNEDTKDWRPPKTARQRQQEQKQQASIVTKALRQQLGFTLRTGPSTIPTAGQGVFLEGKARIGTLLAFFPGLVYLPEHLKTPEDVAQLFPDPDFMLFSRYDKVVIDSRAAEQQPRNEYALAHLCNHGPPNVMALAYNFPQDPLGWEGFPHDLRPYIPNSYAKPRTWLGNPDQSALIQTVALVAATDIEEGEELILNYRLNPKHGKEKLPPWYKPVEVEEDERRWNI